MATKGAVTIEVIPLKKIKLAKNSRLNVTDEEISGLMQSIKEVGLLQPIGVSKTSTGFEICYGNRRYMAASKLGMSQIPAIVHANPKIIDSDLKNLTENIQRRNISLSEAGRYMEILQKDGLTLGEIAVRLGVKKNYVDSCLKAYSEVPKEFQGFLDARMTNEKGRIPGKIAITTANAINTAKRRFGLKPDQVTMLYAAAKNDERFQPSAIPKYASAMAAGKKDPIGTVAKRHFIVPTFWISEDHRNDLVEKYVTDGPFKSLNQLMLAILRGEESVKIEILK